MGLEETTLRNGLCIALLATLVTGCATTGSGTYGSEWKNGKRPSSSTLLACAEYARVSTSYTTQGRPAPTMNQVVTITPSNPTEYEGEITSCDMTSCNVVLRETRRSAMSRQITDTTNKMAEGYYQAGYAIGAAMAESRRRKREEEARQIATDECLLVAGYEKELVRFEEMGGDKTCKLPHTVPDKVGSQEVPVVFRNFTQSPVALTYLRPNGQRQAYGSIESFREVRITSRKGHAWEMSDETTGACLSRAIIYEAPTKTIITLATVDPASPDHKVADQITSPQVERDDSAKLQRYFMEVVLGVSSQSSDSTRLKKWGSQILVRVIGNDKVLNAELSDLMDEVNSLVGRRVLSFASNDSVANYTVVFGSSYLFSAYEPKASPTHKASNWYCSWRSWSITNCTIFVDPNAPGSSREKRSYLRRQLTTSLGLMRKSNAHRDSVFYKKYSTLVNFSDEDKQLIKWLYDERLSAGMSAADVQSNLF